MKKVLFTAFAAMAMFAVVACNNKKAEETVDTTTCAAMEQCEHKCMHEGDSAMCCKAEAVAEGCEMKCEKACEQKCDKAEGQKCCKAEGKECEKKCENAQ